jgi:predicted ester cyclase
MSSNSTVRAHLERFVDEVWNRGDLSEVERFIAPLYTIHHDPGDPWDKKVLDLPGYKHRVLLSRAPFPDQRFDIQGLFEDAGAIVMTWLWAATHLGDIPGFPATGRPISMSGATVYFVSDGLFSGHWQITDRLGVYMQLRQASQAG